MRKRIIYLSCFCSGLMLLTGCPDPSIKLQKIEAWTSFMQNRAGTWQWIKTVTPSRVETPQTTGHTQRLQTGFQPYSDTLTFYKDQRVSFRLYPDQSTNMTQEVDPKLKTMLTSYLDSAKSHRYYVKFFFNVERGATTMETSIPLPYLNPEYDTVRVYYQKL